VRPSALPNSGVLTQTLKPVPSAGLKSSSPLLKQRAPTGAPHPLKTASFWPLSDVLGEIALDLGKLLV
jgi:hypothetical protein